MNRLVWMLFFILGVPVLTQAFEIRAFVDRTHTLPGESVQLTVSQKGGEAEVNIAGIRDFKVISQGTSTSVQIINGRISKEIAHNYMLMPLKEGRLRIPPLSVVWDGETYQTREIIVQVSPASDRDDPGRDVFVEAHVSGGTPYEGQQIIYTFKLFSAIRIANARLQKPSFTGFTAKEVDDKRTYRTAIAGREYQVTEVTHVLVPLHAGEVTIEPAVLKLDIVRRPSARRNRPFDSLFDDPFFGRSRLDPKILRTDSVVIDVQPLPAYAGPARFSGLVGDFRMRADLESPEIAVGDTTTLSVTIEGAGNIMDASEPVVPVPEAFKVYADKPEETIHLDASGFSGNKIFRFALVALKEGQYEIEPIRLSFFNVSAEKYETLSTRAFLLAARPSAGKDEFAAYKAPEALPRPGLQKKKVEFTGRDILPLKEGLDALESREGIPLLRFVVLLLAPVMLWLGVSIAVRLTHKRDVPATVMAQRAESALKRARKTPTSSEEFLACLYRALVFSILACAGARGESLTYAEAQAMLRSNGYSSEIAGQAAELLKKIESARYGGLTMDPTFSANLFSETRQLIRRLAR